MPSSLSGYELSFPAMGSTVSLSAYAESKVQVERGFSKARAEIDRLVKILSDYDPESEVSRLLNENSLSQPMSGDLWAVMLAAENWYRRSQGAFDASLGNLTRLWKESRRTGKIPETDEVAFALLNSGWDKIQLDPDLQKARCVNSKVRLDLGGIAAGYIVDRAYEILVAEGLPCCIVNAGGDIRCGKPPPDRAGWKIEVASANKQGPPLRRIHLANAAITTSGDLWQFAVVDGQRRSHILDPRTGYGILGPMSVTVIAPQCIDADAAATAIAVVGSQDGKKLAESLEDFEAIWVSRTNSDQPEVQWVTEGFPESIE